MSQRYIEPVYYYLDGPQTMGNTQKIQDTLVHFTVPLRKLSRWGSTLQKHGYHWIRPLELNFLAISVIHPHVTNQGVTVFFSFCKIICSLKFFHRKPPSFYRPDLSVWTEHEDVKVRHEPRVCRRDSGATSFISLNARLASFRHTLTPLLRASSENQTTHS